MSSFSKEMIRQRALKRLKDEAEQLPVEFVPPDKEISTPEDGLLSITPEEESGPKSSMRDALSRRIPFYTASNTNPKAPKQLPKKK